MSEVLTPQVRERLENIFSCKVYDYYSNMESSIMAYQLENGENIFAEYFCLPEIENAESNPLVYFPETGNLIFSGSIPCLSDLKFQFSMNDVTGAPYIFVDGLALTDDVMTTLLKLQGYYKNWRDEWLVADDILGQLSKNNKK